MVEKHKIPNNSILKIDCEGCEVDILLNIEKETIQLFSEIQVEYHFGYENIKQKLESFGFDVITSIPHQQQDTQSEKILNVGFLYAKKISKHIS